MLTRTCPHTQDGGGGEELVPPPPPPGVMMNATPHVAPELPLPMSTQEPEGGEASDADVDKAPPYCQDGGGCHH